MIRAIHERCRAARFSCARSAASLRARLPRTVRAMVLARSQSDSQGRKERRSHHDQHEREDQIVGIGVAIGTHATETLLTPCQGRNPLILTVSVGPDRVNP